MKGASYISWFAPPDMDGRSFGTNVIEALLVCLSGKKQELTEANAALLDQLNFPIGLLIWRLLLVRQRDGAAK